MNKKIRVGILFGGRSSEHEISLRSARSVVAGLDLKQYVPVLIGIDKNGVWLDEKSSRTLLSEGKSPKIKGIPDLMPQIDPRKVDIMFPVLHGSFGEDGTMQGFLKLIDMPFVGPGVLGSSTGMDKDVTKRLLHEAGIGVARGLVYKKHELSTIRFAIVQKKLGLPLFIKPANAGSSVGVSKVRNKKEFDLALAEAFKFDSKILIEEAIVGREIEVAVLGNEYPTASIPGEIIPGEEFYSYADKYASTSASIAKIPADLPKAFIKKIQETAVRAYQTLSLEGMTRVDFFVTPKGDFLINEVNTIPGFTSISMYPKLWEASGIAFPKLLDKLIRFALDRQKKEKRLKTSL